MILAKKDLFIFDLDGVIYDSKKNMEFAWECVKNELSIEIEFSRYFSYIGRPFKDIIALLGLKSQLLEISEIYFRASLEKTQDVCVYPGVIEVLAILQKRGTKLAVLTSKDELRTKILLQKMQENIM